MTTNTQGNDKRKKTKRIIGAILLAVIIIIILLLRGCQGTKLGNETMVLGKDPISVGEKYEPKFYDITFLDADGKTVLGTISVKEGEVPNCDELVEKYSDSFIGWDKELIAANDNATYVAVIKGNGNSTDTVENVGISNGVQNKHEHGWVFVKTHNPTCIDDGYDEYICEGCEETFKDAFVNKLGHEYTIQVVDPTCTEDGYTIHTCNRCGDTYNDTPVEALGHNYVSVVTDPTCTEDGYTTYTCDRCGDEYVDDIVPALGHDYQYDRDNIVELSNGITNVYKVYKCSVCGEECQEYWYTTFAYVGAVQEYTVEKDGIYDVEAWGAQSGSGEKGGYVKGEVELHEGDTLYVVVGGAGANRSGTAGGAGGYNGGGKGGNGGYRKGKTSPGGAGGGGATSIALADADATEEDKEKLNKTLPQVGKEEFDENGLMVAGGAGGRNFNTGARGDVAGGSNPTTSNFGQGNNGRNGYNASCCSYGNGGGGGGYYGGYSKSSGIYESGAGGSSWVNENEENNIHSEIENIEKQAGVNGGNGKAQITFLEDLPEETPEVPAEAPATEDAPAETPEETPEVPAE